VTQETICQECSGAGFFGGNGPTVERLCQFCNGTGVLVEDGPINVRAVARLDEIQVKQIYSAFASMRKDEGRQLFHQIQERRMHREAFGI
jgi:DnaJ-class molecular chaperone